MVLTVSNGLYEIVDELTKQSVNCTTRAEAVEKLAELGVLDEAVKEAFEYILEFGHRKAVFGVRGTLIYSEK